MLVVTHPVPAWEQVLIIISGGLALIVLPFLAKIAYNLVHDVHEIKVVLVGEQPTPLNPSPPAGMISNVNKLMDLAGANLVGTKALIDDKTPNDGSSMRDAIDRIEVEQQRHDPGAPTTPSHP
jgi:hypothetical protein